MIYLDVLKNYYTYNVFSISKACINSWPMIIPFFWFSMYFYDKFINNAFTLYIRWSYSVQFTCINSWPLIFLLFYFQCISMVKSLGIHLHYKNSKVKWATIVEGNPKAPFSIATTPRCRGGRYSFPGLLYFTLDSYLIMLSVKQGGIKYHFLSLWYDSTWDWTQVSRAIGEHYSVSNWSFEQCGVLVYCHYS